MPWGVLREALCETWRVTARAAFKGGAWPAALAVDHDEQSDEEEADDGRKHSDERRVAATTTCNGHTQCMYATVRRIHRCSGASAGYV